MLTTNSTPSKFAGLMCSGDYFESIGENQRNVAFIPTSAHGTNPASASLCGLTIVPISAWTMVKYQR